MSLVTRAPPPASGSPQSVPRPRRHETRLAIRPCRIAVQLTLTGEPRQRHLIGLSPDLRQWTPILTVKPLTASCASWSHGETALKVFRRDRREAERDAVACPTRARGLSSRLRMAEQSGPANTRSLLALIYASSSSPACLGLPDCLDAAVRFRAWAAPSVLAVVAAFSADSLWKRGCSTGR